MKPLPATMVELPSRYKHGTAIMDLRSGRHTARYVGLLGSLRIRPEPA